MANIYFGYKSTRSPYQSRAVRQMILWVNGVNRHNFIDSECTPDFRCCAYYIPETPLEDRQKMLAEYLTTLSKPLTIDFEGLL